MIRATVHSSGTRDAWLTAATRAAAEAPARLTGLVLGQLEQEVGLDVLRVAAQPGQRDG